LAFTSVDIPLYGAADYGAADFFAKMSDINANGLDEKTPL